MNGRKAKQLRRLAEEDAYHHYQLLLNEEERKELTKDMAVQYTPKVSYVEIASGSEKRPYTKVTVVSENTLRWFSKQRKKYYAEYFG